jgi:hypothetical protein
MLVAEAYEEGEEIVAGALLDKLSDEKSEAYLREITFEKHGISKLWEDIHPGADEKKILMKYAKDTLRKFKLQQVSKRINENHKRLEEAVEETEKLKIMKENIELEKEKNLVTKELSNEEVL